MNRRQILIIAVLIFVPTLILFLVSYFVQPVLPPPWNNVLILLGVVLGATLAALSAFNDIVQLVDRFTGRSPSQSPPNPQPAPTNVQQTGRDSYGSIQAQHATITQTFNLPPSPPLPCILATFFIAQQPGYFSPDAIMPDSLRWRDGQVVCAGILNRDLGDLDRARNYLTQALTI